MFAADIVLHIGHSLKLNNIYRNVRYIIEKCDLGCYDVQFIGR